MLDKLENPFDGFSTVSGISLLFEAFLFKEFDCMVYWHF
jgi:hypothetical protein